MGPASSEHKHTNRLIDETSPYLLQHAHNPVDWRPWGDEAFAEARRLGKPVFLSIGYSTCHWCHVMEEESFEDEEIASVMNDLYVSIKVDREERPDVDADLHDRGPGADRLGRLADERLADARSRAVLRRHVFSPARRRARRAPRLPHGPARRARRLRLRQTARRARDRRAGGRGPRAHGGERRSGRSPGPRPVADHRHRHGVQAPLRRSRRRPPPRARSFRPTCRSACCCARTRARATTWRC